MGEAVQQQKKKNGGGGGAGKKKEETPVTVTVVLKITHCCCQGCANKIIKCVKRFEGVQTVKAEIEAKKLTVVGKKIDPSKIIKNILIETKKKVELISPQPKKEKDSKSNDHAQININKSEKNPPKELRVTTAAQCDEKIHRVTSTSTSKGVDEMSVDRQKDPVTVKALSERLKRPLETIPAKEVKEKDDTNKKKKEAGGDGKTETGGGGTKVETGFRNPRHPKHDLELKTYVKPYTCDGCKETGFGPRYRCEECNFELHKECKFPKTSPFTPKFLPGSNFEFLTTPQKASHDHRKRRCEACRMDINGFVYHCENKNLDLHPCCADLKKIYRIKDEEGGEMVFNLYKNVQGECMWCQKKSIKEGDNSNGWSYICKCRNSNSKYHVHVACITQMILEEWKHRKVDNGNPTLALQKVNAKAMQPRGRSRGGTSNKFWRILKVFIKTIVTMVVGSLDPTGLASIVLNLA